MHLVDAAEIHQMEIFMRMGKNLLMHIHNLVFLIGGCKLFSLCEDVLYYAPRHIQSTKHESTFT